MFLLVYFVTSLAIGDFYKVPVASAFLLACAFSIMVSKGSLLEKLDTFSKGAGHPNVLLMVWIFILAGAFASTAKDIGAVDATVNAALHIIPPKMLYAGLFLTACFISMAIGTSVGTVVALVPIGAGIAAQNGISAGFMTAVILGGAFFGDNLSFISDTTIAATRAVGCEMRDKFKVNILIIAPAVVIVTILYILMGQSLEAVAQPGATQLVKLLPYVLIIVLALMGWNVTYTLSLGVAVNALIGFIYGDFTWSGWLMSIGSGIAGMSDLIIVTLLAGGLLEMIRVGGGLDFIIGRLSTRIGGRRSAQFSIAALVMLANVCTANNTVAIITTGGIAKDISERFGIDPRKTASLLDTFSCFMQGMLPYGAQVLMACGLTGLTAVDIIPKLYYPFIMGGCAVLAIIFNYPKKYSR